jgi:hypothetical protein
MGNRKRDGRSQGRPANCDINLAGVTNVADLQLIINEVLGVSPAIHDLNHDGAVNVADVQKVINAALDVMKFSAISRRQAAA